MHALLSAFTPIWVLTATGYAVGRGGLLGAQAEAVLGRFVFHVAMPAALFVMVSEARLSSFVNQSMIAFGAGTAVVCVLGFVAAGRFLGRKTADRAVGGMASGYVNSANLGIPVAVQVLGLPEHQVLAVVLCSALPTAQNAFLYAREYGLDTALARHSVVATTVVSMATLSLTAWALGPAG